MVKIQEVAKKAGVSLTTVSHVVNHRDRVSIALRERVEKAIEELGYQPNPLAQSLRTGRTNLIALMIPDICNPYYTELVRAIQTELGEVEVDTLIYNTDVPGGHSEDHGHEYLRQIKRKRVDGLIVADAALHRIQDELFSIDLPTVFIGNLPNKAVDSIEMDGYDAAYRMGEYLVSKGHQRIAHVTGPSFFNMSMVRQAGFEKALTDNGIAIDDRLRFEGSFLGPSGHEAVDWLLAEHGADMPSAMFVANTLMAIGALAEFADRGLSVPQDIAVAAFDTFDQQQDIRPRLTTIGVRPSEVAKGALALLNDRLTEQYAGASRQTVLKARMEIHQTA